jgi:formyl-CoA transferase
VSAWLVTRDPDDAVACLQDAGIPAFVAARNRDLADDAHLRERGFFVEHPHAEIGTRVHCGVPWTMSASDSRVRSAAPCLGEHTDQVLRDVCGYDAAQVAALREAGVLA